MKQTKGCLSFLLSAYRSIFASAYTKGIAAAVVLTAGLSAGAANADAVAPLYDSFDAAKGEAVTTVSAAGSTITLDTDKAYAKYANGMNSTFGGQSPS